MEATKFSAASLLIAAIILGGAICLHALTNRYHFEQSNPPGVTYIFDTWTGHLEMRD